MTSAQTGFPSTLVVIPTLNEAATIEAVLRSLLEGIGAEQPLLIAVVDGGSSDATRAIVQDYRRADARVSLMDNPQRIQSAAMNVAVKGYGARYDVLMRCDAHSEYPPGFIATVTSSLIEHDADSLVIPMDSVGHNCVGRAVAWVSDSPVGSGGSLHRGGQKSGWVKHGHHAGWRMAMYRTVGGYDDGFTHNEDVELDCRILAFGGRIYLDADIRIRYFTRGTLTFARQAISILWTGAFAYPSAAPEFSGAAQARHTSLRPRQLSGDPGQPLEAVSAAVAARLPSAAGGNLDPDRLARAIGLRAVRRARRSRYAQLLGLRFPGGLRHDPGAGMAAAG